MSAKRKKDKMPAIHLDLEGLASILQTWEEHRRVRDMGGGNRRDSETILAQITGKWTDIELIHGMINAYEREAEAAFRDWRKSHSFELQADDSKTSRKDPAEEIYRFHELLRVVVASGDKELIAAWLAERSWAERILASYMFKQKPSREIITS